MKKIRNSDLSKISKTIRRSRMIYTKFLKEKPNKFRFTIKKSSASESKKSIGSLGAKIMNDSKLKEKVTKIIKKGIFEKIIALRKGMNKLKSERKGSLFKINEQIESVSTPISPKSLSGPKKSGFQSREKIPDDSLNGSYQSSVHADSLPDNSGLMSRLKSTPNSRKFSQHLKIIITNKVNKKKSSVARLRPSKKNNSCKSLHEAGQKDLKNPQHQESRRHTKYNFSKLNIIESPMVKLADGDEMNEDKEFHLSTHKLEPEALPKPQLEKSRNHSSAKKRIISTMKNKRLFAKVHKMQNLAPSRLISKSNLSALSIAKKTCKDFNSTALSMSTARPFRNTSSYFTRNIGSKCTSRSSIKVELEKVLRRITKKRNWTARRSRRALKGRTGSKISAGTGQPLQFEVADKARHTKPPHCISELERVYVHGFHEPILNCIP
ncbi:unnamed protein product [Moneuplotes crassus]|uniref:Uncharacterized protein n=1 Tax=Euplotes crassus TaxID=5936 RepID=A0AAD2D9N2_EUPCR|nr:unnamed protein product [Moneuplotes crassus]